MYYSCNYVIILRILYDRTIHNYTIGEGRENVLQGSVVVKFLVYKICMTVCISTWVYNWLFPLRGHWRSQIFLSQNVIRVLPCYYYHGYHVIVTVVAMDDFFCNSSKSACLALSSICHYALNAC